MEKERNYREQCYMCDKIIDVNNYYVVKIDYGTHILIEELCSEECAFEFLKLYQ
ncbi:MAG: hypothetical protein ACTSQI_07765 [Candidatus Helarchaeota archaeon]